MLTKMDEKRQLKAMREGLFEAFPNPERKGCPGTDVMRAIIAGKMEREEQDKWVDHFVMCSPCSKEFYEIRRRYIRKKSVRTTGIVSSVVLLAAFGVWGWVHYLKTSKSGGANVVVARVLSFRQQVLDVRNWSGERTDGGTGNLPHKPLILHRWPTELVIYLPSGSEAGKYEVRIVSREGRKLDMSGTTRIENGNTVFRAKVNLSQLQPGQYSLGIRQLPLGWRYLPLAVK